MDFRKLLAIQFTDYRTVRTDSVAALSRHIYIKWTKYFLGRIVAGLLLAKI